MTPQEIQQLKGLIVATSMYYGQELQDQVLSLFIEDLRDLPFERVCHVIKEIRRDPKTTRFPLPASIRDRVLPTNSDEAEGREAAARILQAIARCGWNNPERAKEFVGDLGWYVVERNGGWLNTCQHVSEDNLSQMQAQWRELAISARRRAKLGLIDTAPVLQALDQSKASTELQSLGSVFQGIQKKISNESESQ